MKAPHKVKSLYQVRTYIGLDTDETNYFISFNSYKKAKERFEEEVTRANREYLVELLSVVEIQETKDTSKTESQYLALADNL